MVFGATSKFFFVVFFFFFFFFFSFRFYFFLLLTSLMFVLLFKNVQGKERLRNSVNLPELEVAEADPINTFMMTWLKAEDKRTEREEKRRDEDRLQQEHWMQMIAEAQSTSSCRSSTRSTTSTKTHLAKVCGGSR